MRFEWITKSSNNKKRNKTNIDFKKVPVLTVCAKSAPELYKNVRGFNTEMRIYEGRNFTASQVIEAGTSSKVVNQFKKDYKAHQELMGNLDSVILGCYPENLEEVSFLRLRQEGVLAPVADNNLPMNARGIHITVQDAIISTRISDDGGHKRYAVFACATHGRLW